MSAPSVRLASTAVCIVVSLAFPAGRVAADATGAAELFLATCVASADDPAGIEAMARERGWRTEDGSLVFFPLSKRGDPLQHKSAWRGLHNGQDFVIGVGTEIAAGESSHVCMAAFKDVGMDEFLQEIARTRQLITKVEPTPQDRFGAYQLQGGNKGDLALLVATDPGGSLYAWSLWLSKP